MSKRSKQAQVRAIQVINEFFGNNEVEASNVYISFMNHFYHDSSMKETKMMRLAPLFCRLALECGFYQHRPNNKALLRLERIMGVMRNEPKLTDIDINNTTFSDLDKIYGTLVDQRAEEECEKIRTAEFVRNEEYTLVGPLSFDDLAEFKDYCGICYITSVIWYNHYTCNGTFNMYCLLKDGYENIKKRGRSFDAEDEYALSMVFFVVDDDGELAFCNIRYNHDVPYTAEGTCCDHALTKEKICSLYGDRLDDIFKPSGISFKEKVEGIVKKAEEDDISLLEVLAGRKIVKSTLHINGVQWTEVCFKGRWNIIKDNRFILDEWVQDVNYKPFFGYILVVKNKLGQYNLFDTFKEEYVLGEWFEGMHEINLQRSGHMIFRLNGKYKIVSSYPPCNLRFSDWYDDVYGGKAGSEYLIVEKDGQINIMNMETGQYSLSEDEVVFAVRDKVMDSLFYIQTNVENKSKMFLYDAHTNRRSILVDDIGFSEDFYWVGHDIKKGSNIFSKNTLEPLNDKWYDFVGVCNDCDIFIVMHECKYNYMNIGGEFLLKEWVDNALPFTRFADNKLKTVIIKNGTKEVIDYDELLAEKYKDK